MTKESANVSNVNESLTNIDWAWLDTLQIPEEVLRPVRTRKPLDSLLLDAELSPATRVAEERRLARLERKRKALRKRKRYTRKRGTVHPKKKLATRKRKLARDWALRPYECVVHGWGAYSIEKSQWENKLGMYWQKFLPEELTVERIRHTKKKGSKEDPYTIYDLRVVHSDLGVLYDGESEKLWELSLPAVAPP